MRLKFKLKSSSSSGKPVYPFYLFYPPPPTLLGQVIFLVASSTRPVVSRPTKLPLATAPQSFVPSVNFDTCHRQRRRQRQRQRRRQDRGQVVPRHTTTYVNFLWGSISISDSDFDALVKRLPLWGHLRAAISLNSGLIITPATRCNYSIKRSILFSIVRLSMN